MFSKGRPMRRGLVVALGTLSMLGAGCDARPPESAAPPAREEVAPIALGGAFVAVPRTLTAETQQRLREGLGQSVAALKGDASETFYLAIRKSELGQRYFLSAYLKQHFPGEMYGGQATSLGTRVVSFQVQNGKLFVFDVDERKVRSDLFDPQVLVEAWPLVTDHEAFNGLRGSDEYVLFDPAAGLNRFGVVDDLEAPYGYRFEVQLAFSQRFRELADGITFEQLFMGYSSLPHGGLPANQGVETNPYRGAGTLGLALRRYREGEGYTPTALPPREHYFRSRPLLVPHSGGKTAQVASKWNIHPGMKPIEWVLSDSLVRAQQDPRFQGYDLLGAAKRGVEGWNAAFGFPVFTARVAQPGESFADDDTNALLFDLDTTFGAAFANWRTNPNTGEVRGASVYVSSSIVMTTLRFLSDDAPALAPSVEAPSALAAAPSLSWNGMRAERLCALDARALEALTASSGQGALAASVLPSLTKKEKVERAFTHLVLHEIGHTLGLRHNFKGSFSLPATSVMEYVDIYEQPYRDTPGPYDEAAVRYLYGLSSALPSQPFCTDPDTSVDPSCNRYDTTANPLELFHGVNYREWFDAALAGLAPAPSDVSINGVAQHVRAGASPQVRLRAFELLMHGIRAPIAPEVLASSPRYPSLADTMARRIFQRLYLDPASARGLFTADPPVDALLTPAILEQLRANLLNVDGVRGYPTRRVVVDVLKKLQRYEAYAILREARDALTAARPGLSGNELLAADDLASRIDRALSPYFN